MPRPVPDIISTGMDLMARMPAPENFKLAGMLTIMSSLMGRRVWVDNEWELPRAYPNLYTMLVAPPGVGKDIVISWVRKALTTLQEYVGVQRRIWASAGTSISPKGIYDALNSSDHCEQHFRWSGEPQSFRSLTFLIGEMSTIMPDYNQALIGILNELYNCEMFAEDRIRGQDYLIPNPHITMLLGNQPATLFETLPEKAFHMGFTSRLCIFQAFEKVKRKRSKKGADNSDLYPKFLDALHDVTLMTGGFKITPDADLWLDDFEEDNPFPVPGSRWIDYNPRRILHVQKLAMICSASERSDRKLNVNHLERALEIMRSYEKDMPHLFDGVVSSEGFSSIYEDVRNLCEQLAKPILVKKNDGTEVLSHYEVTHLILSRELSRTTNVHKVEKLFAELIRSGVLTVKMQKVEGQQPVPIVPRTYIVRVDI
jgi:hypothetical protein